MARYVILYKAFLKLYPASYRYDYETEMVKLFSELLAETNSASGRVLLLLRSTSETLKWATPEVTASAEKNVAVAPKFIKFNTCFSVLCILPFFCASLYRIHMLYDPEAKPALLGLFIHTHLLYASILPVIGLLIASGTIIWSLLRSERYWHVSWSMRLQTGWHNSLLIFCCIGVAALVILT